MALQLEAGFGHAVWLLEQNHLCIATGTEGNEDKLAPVLGWEEVPPAKEPAGCGAAPGAPGLAGKALSKNGMSSGEAVPTNLTSYMAVGLSGLDFFSVYFPSNEKKCLFFSVSNFQRGKMESPALKPSVIMHAQEMPKFRVSQSCYAYSPYTTLSAAAWPSTGSNLCGWQRQQHCPLAVNTGMWPSTFTIAVNQLVAFLI